jgi:signal transduction histidine kinase
LQLRSKNSTGDAGERLKVARDLHDTIAQEIAALGYACDEAISLSPSGATRTSLVAIRARLSLLGVTLRDEISALRGGHGGLGRALAALLPELAIQSEIEIVNDIPHELTFDERVDFELYRSLRELISNIIAHADAKQILLTITQTRSRHEFTITDDGVENTEISSVRDFHFGTIGVQERLALIGAEISYRREAGQNIYRILLLA